MSEYSDMAKDIMERKKTQLVLKKFEDELASTKTDIINVRKTFQDKINKASENLMTNLGKNLDPLKCRCSNLEKVVVLLNKLLTDGNLSDVEKTELTALISTI